jgi:hypothetical protein
MWIRNKGTRNNPRYALVESRRISRQKHPRQKVLCYMGKSRDFQTLVGLWKILAADARNARRKNLNSIDRDEEYPLLKIHAHGLSTLEINFRLRRYEACAMHYEEYIARKSAARF